MSRRKRAQDSTGGNSRDNEMQGTEASSSHMWSTTQFNDKTYDLLSVLHDLAVSKKLSNIHKTYPYGQDASKRPMSEGRFVGHLSNMEVLDIMKEESVINNTELYRDNENLEGLGTVTYEIMQYLETNNLLAKNTSEEFDKILTYIADFHIPFTKEEKLQLVNVPPRSPLEFMQIVDDAMYRMNDEDALNFLSGLKTIMKGSKFKYG